MRYDTEYRGTELEVRILGIEDTLATLSKITRTLAEMTGNLTEIMGHTADSLGGLILALPSTTRRHLWSVGASSAMAGDSGAGTCCGGCASQDPLPNTP